MSQALGAFAVGLLLVVWIGGAEAGERVLRGIARGTGLDQVHLSADLGETLATNAAAGIGIGLGVALVLVLVVAVLR